MTYSRIVRRLRGHRDAFDGLGEGGNSQNLSHLYNSNVSTIFEANLQIDKSTLAIFDV